jgi:hypothetical protein
MYPAKHSATVALKIMTPAEMADSFEAGTGVGGWVAGAGEGAREGMGVGALDAEVKAIIDSMVAELEVTLSLDVSRLYFAAAAVIAAVKAVVSLLLRMFAGCTLGSVMLPPPPRDWDTSSATKVAVNSTSMLPELSRRRWPWPEGLFRAIPFSPLPARSFRA